MAYHNLTRAFELAKNTSTLSVFHKWQWKVEPANNEGWSKITDVESGMFLTSRLKGRTSKLTLENEGMHDI